MNVLDSKIRLSVGPIFGVAVLGGLALLNIRTTHNWGGDFSMYIHQAKNIVAGIPQVQNGYLYSIVTAYHGTQTYPVGFPLLLSPFYAIFGNSIYHFLWLVAALTFAFSLLAWRYLQTITHDLLWSFALTYLLVANPWFIEFKGNVLSDIPFSAFTMGVILLMGNQRIGHLRALALGALIGYAILLRTAGVTLLGGLGLFFMTELWIGRRLKARISIRALLAILIVSASIFASFQYVFFPAPSVRSYSDTFEFMAMIKMISRHGDYYIKTIREIIPNAGPVIFQTLLYHFLIVGVFVGFIWKFLKQRTYAECFAVAYVGLLLIWPGLQGFRLLLPVTALGLGYAFEALRLVRPEWVSGKRGGALAVLILLVATGVFAHPVIRVAERVYKVQEGPQTPEAVEAFEFVRQRTPPEAIIAFNNPRVLALYGERNAIADPHYQNENEIFSHYDFMGARYYLIDSRNSEESIRKAVKSRARLVFKNNRFELFYKNE